MIYQYRNSKYEPRIHDFGDDYHLPDLEINDNEVSLLVEVKKIRRRYTNWFNYQDAVKLYDNYMRDLMDKYGGKSNFKLAMLLNQVHEYIPNYPELRKTKKNRFFAKHRISRETREMIEENPFNGFITTEDQYSNEKVKVRITNDKKLDDIYEGLRGKYKNISSAEIATDLDLLDAFYRSRQQKIERVKNKKKKKKMKAVLNRKALRLQMNYRSLTDLINIYNKNKKNKFMNKNEGLDQMISYKDVIIRQSEMENLDVINRLKAIGVHINKLNKSSRKIIRKTKSSSKKMKKNQKREKRFLSDFMNSQFDDFKDFEDQMIECTGTRRFR